MRWSVVVMRLSFGVPGMFGVSLFLSNGVSPLPFLKQVRDRVMKPGQQLFSIERTGWREETALRGAATDFDQLAVRINDPGQCCAIGKEIRQPFVSFAASFGGRENLDRQVRR